MCFISFKFQQKISRNINKHFLLLNHFNNFITRTLKQQENWILSEVFSLTNKQDGQQIISQNKQTRRFIKQKLISMDFPRDWLVDFLTHISYVLFSYTHYLTNITSFWANNFYSDTWSDVSLCTLPIYVCVCMNMYVCMMNSTHSEKAIMFSNGKVMSERLFEPLSSVSGSIV